MEKIFLVIKREYLTRVRKKSFLIMTILVPILFGLLIFGSAYLATQSNSKMRILVKDETPGLYQNKVRGMDLGETLTFHYTKDTLESTAALLKTYLSQGYDGILVIEANDFTKPIGFSYHSNNHLGSINQAHIENKLTEQWRTLVAENIGIQQKDIVRLEERVELHKVINQKSAISGSTEAGTAIGYIMGFLIYMYLIYYGVMVMRGVIEEKTNRIVEVMISSIKPFQLMMGKILGIGAVGLTQFSIWAVLILLINIVASFIIGDSLSSGMDSTAQMNGALANANSDELAFIIREVISSIDWFRIIFSFIFYFIFGYILYAALFGAVGSAVSEDGEANTFTFPIMLPIILSFVLMSSVVQEPNSALAIWCSMIPFTSPILMLARIPFDIPWYQELLSMFILVVSCIIVVWLAARIYRVGILMQGKKATAKELWKWLRHSV